MQKGEKGVKEESDTTKLLRNDDTGFGLEFRTLGVCMTVMRTNLTSLTIAAAIAWLWPVSAVAQRQIGQIETAAVSQMTGHAVGTVVEMGEWTMAIRSEENELIKQRFRYTHATRWVDESGTPVPRQSFRPGAAVIVHYRRSEDGMEISSVGLRKSPAVAGRSQLKELATAVAAMQPNRVPGAPPEVLGPPLPQALVQIAEGPESETEAKPETVVKRRVVKNTERRVPKVAPPPVAPKKRGWLERLFAGQNP